jgi:site-specific DNA-cytosine methylase
VVTEKIKARRDRVKCLGNAVVPQVAARWAQRIVELEVAQ